MNIKVCKKERIYFWLMFCISLPLYGAIIASFYTGKYSYLTAHFPALGYLFIFFIIVQLAKLCLIGHIRGSAIKITSEQFPDIYDILNNQARLLGFSRVPNMYLQQGGGVLNAFAARLARTNYVVLYSSVFEVAYQDGMSAVEFIIAHELGHIKRKHVYGLKSFFIFPAELIPFLSLAYSRACEYTCDSIGYALCPKGAIPGMLILLSGSNLYKKVDVTELLKNAKTERGFLTWFAEVFSSHPLISKRIEALQSYEQNL